MVNLKQVVIPYIQLIPDNNTTNKFPSRLKGYSDMNPHLLSEHYHQTILDKIGGSFFLITRNMWKMKINTV